jgi:hypothetical protein
MLIAPNAEARKLFDSGVRDQTGLVVEMRQPASATADPGCSCIEEIFFSMLQANRQRPDWKDKSCTFLRNNQSILCSDRFLRGFAGKG